MLAGDGGTWGSAETPQAINGSQSLIAYGSSGIMLGLWINSFYALI